MPAISGQTTADGAMVASTKCKTSSEFKGVTGSFAPKSMSPDIQFYTKKIGRLPIQKTWSPAVSGRKVVVLKFRYFDWILVLVLFCWVFFQFHGYTCVLFSSHLHRYKCRRTLKKAKPDPIL